MMQALVRLSEESAGHEGLPAWVFGAVAFTVLLLLLIVVTRFDPNR